MTRRLRIAVLNRHFGRRFGGAESYSVALVEQLAARHDLHVFAQEFDHPGLGITLHRVPRPLAKPRWLNQLWYAAWTWQATRRGFDVVHSHENTWHGQIQTVHVRPLRVGLFHGLSAGRRILKTLQILTSPRLLAYWWLEGSRFRPRRDRRIVASSTSVRDEVLQAYPHAAGMMSVIPPGTLLPAGPADPAAARRQLKLPADVPLALFAGNDYVKKGLPALLEALTRLPADLHLAVAGNPAPIAAFRAQAKQLGVGARVHFLGSLRDMVPAYTAADLLVHPTTEDTYAMVVLEALAHGLPVIVSGPAHCGIATELRDGVDALLVDDPRDADALARAIARVRTDVGLAAALGLAGRAFAAARDWDARAAVQEALYFEAAGNATG